MLWFRTKQKKGIQTKEKNKKKIQKCQRVKKKKTKKSKKGKRQKRKKNKLFFSSFFFYDWELISIVN